jgi:hypothetical protein
MWLRRRQSPAPSMRISGELRHATTSSVYWGKVRLRIAPAAVILTRKVRLEVRHHGVVELPVILGLVASRGRTHGAPDTRRPTPTARHTPHACHCSGSRACRSGRTSASYTDGYCPCTRCTGPCHRFQFSVAGTATTGPPQIGLRALEYHVLPKYAHPISPSWICLMVLG